jgi:isopentenyl phosphate kinase
MHITNILKLGGSVITDKKGHYSIRYADVYRIAQEISLAYSMCSKRMLIVHGGGSFGHPTVAEHGGVENPIATSQVVYFMRELNMVIVDALNAYGVPAIPMDTHAIFYRDCEKFLQFFYKPLEKAIEKSIVPVLYGDVVFGCKGSDVLSGDEIVWRLSTVFKPCRILFASDVDGVYDKHPSEVGAKLLDVVSLHNIGVIEFGSQGRTDVTGEMKAKLLYGLRYWHGDIAEVLIFNGLKKGRIYNALCGKDVHGTRVIL